MIGSSRTKRQRKSVPIAGWGLLLAGVLLTGIVRPELARAETQPAPTPSAEQVKAAGLAFDAGRQAFRSEQYAEAAEHFEEADGLVPNPKVLMNAVAARFSAGQFDRAGSLAVLALRTYPDDPDVVREMRELISRLPKSLHRLEVTCEAACRIVVGTRLIHGPMAKQHTVYLESDEADLKASFESGETVSQVYSPTGATGEITFEAPLPSEPDPAPAAMTPPGPGPSTTPERDTGVSRGGLPRSVFWIGAGLTGALGIAATASAIDTVGSPGADRVERECAGQGESCELYQTGRDKQLRTNVLWGVTGGLFLVTGAIGLFATDWGGAGDPAAQNPARMAVTPAFDGRRIGLEATGRF